MAINELNAIASFCCSQTSWPKLLIFKSLIESKFCALFPKSFIACFTSDGVRLIFVFGSKQFTITLFLECLQAKLGL